MINILPVLVLVANMQVVQPIIITTADIEIDFTPRTANQMASFYEARGFPKEMLSVLKKQCFITVGILNTSNTKIWLDLSSWTFSSEGKIIKREHRDYWKKRWQDMSIPLNKQSTFRWTLIPEKLDYLPDEHEGGNIVLPFTSKYISVKATFATGEKKQGKPITISSDKLFCAEDAK
ncbi:MAG: hypothetical protein DRQ44_07280 [Gammaproteobacteria bacterium]|nr:MAG: hypothetical protein DRQ44_07280 [Gammaproteobacteria bacterium]